MTLEAILLFTAGLMWGATLLYSAKLVWTQWGKAKEQDALEQAQARSWLRGGSLSGEAEKTRLKRS